MNSSVSVCRTGRPTEKINETGCSNDRCERCSLRPVSYTHLDVYKRQRIGTQFAAMMGGSVITETVFNIPGIGSYIISSINAKDIPAVMTCTLFFAALYCIIMLIMDIFYAYIDPRCV